MKKKVVLLIDEFEVASTGYLQNKFSGQFFGALRSWASSNLITLVTVLATDPAKLKVNLPEVSPFGNIFNVVKLGVFEKYKAFELATLKGTIPLTQEEIDLVVDTTRGHPFLIQMFCSLLIDAKNRNLGQADLQEVKKKFLETLQVYGEAFKDFV